MLSVINAECRKYANSAECRYAECHYAECHYADQEDFHFHGLRSHSKHFILFVTYEWAK
jgi:hypothetical protein